MADNEKPRAAKKRTIDLFPIDLLRLSALAAHYRKASRVDLSEIDVMRLAWEDACLHHGLDVNAEQELPR